MDFTKKFNVGLTLNTNIEEFEAFLKKYAKYIRSFYFSPPVNKYFHTRRNVALNFALPHKRKLFWRMLTLIKEYGVELELLLNTLVLNDDLIKRAADLLSQRGVKVDSVCFLTKYYDSVVEYFPSAKYILSFNNGFRTEKDINEAVENYNFDTIVLGSSFIRNDGLFKSLSDRNKEVYLLLNNGCSFNCATCNNVSTVCADFFKKNLQKRSVEYLYALQSIFPQELDEGIVDYDDVTCFKISNRGNGVKFLSEAMDSYILREVARYVDKDANCYAYWGRAGYFWKYFKKMNLNEILRLKKQLGILKETKDE